MYVTQAARQAKSDSALLLILAMMLAAGVWLVTRLLTR